MIHDVPASALADARGRWWPALAALALGVLVQPALAQTLGEKAKESGCVDKPKVVEGATYRCKTSSGAAAYFNVPVAASAPGQSVPVPDQPPRERRAPGTTPPGNGSPAGFPRVSPETQRGRDEMRRKVLGDELASEERLLAEARNAYANGAPPATAEEKADPQKYAERIAKLRQAVQLHERNIEALRKEIGTVR